LGAVFQSPLTGLASQVALPAKLLFAVESRGVKMAAAVRRRAHARERRGKGDATRSDEAMSVVFFMVFLLAGKRQNEFVESR
jgi:hypothetical protein